MKNSLIPITKEEGKYINKYYPQYIVSTCHKRHYYLTEDSMAAVVLKKVQAELLSQKASKAAKNIIKEDHHIE